MKGAGPSVIVATELAIARLFRAKGRAWVEIVSLHSPCSVHVLAFDTQLGRFSGLSRSSVALDNIANALALECWKLRELQRHGEIP